MSRPVHRARPNPAQAHRARLRLATAHRARLGPAVAASGVTLAVGAALLVGGGTAGAAETAVAVYGVSQEGLTAEQGAALARAFGIENGLQSTGAFTYVDGAGFGTVPSTVVAKGRDESGRGTVSQALDEKALRAIAVPTDEAVLGAGRRLLDLAGLGKDMGVEPSVSHTTLTLADAKGSTTGQFALDSTVTYRITLGGLPVQGQGAKLRITLGPDGKVTQLSHALRRVKPVETVVPIGADAAAKICSGLYPAGVRQATPTLGYQFPELTSTGASGRGAVGRIFPQYSCNPVAEAGALEHRLVPAVAGAAPSGEVKVTRSGDTIGAEVSVRGGTAPYTYRWSSSTTVIPAEAQGRAGVSYLRQPRDARVAGRGEQVTVEVTDADGLTATATVTIAADGSVAARTVPGGGGYGALAVGPVDAGIEQTVDEWQCAQDSAIGFRDVMASHATPVAFDWRGANAWERDFKDPSVGGDDSSYVDNVDVAWYTGHGNPNGFTFKSSVDDTWIVPGDARWGNRDLEWLQLESCQVLRDTNGAGDYFTRWGQSFAGLHILNGFHTNASCVSGGTGGTFAGYLFPRTFLWWTLRPALRVQSAWAAMAIDREPAGVVYRSMGLIGPGGVTNIGDYFWGQGPVGPDITQGSSTGMWAISGTV